MANQVGETINNLSDLAQYLNMILEKTVIRTKEKPDPDQSTRF